MWQEIPVLPLIVSLSLNLRTWEYTEIVWNIVPSDKQQDDKIIIWYTGGVIYSNLYEKLKNRVHFASPDPQDGWRIIKNPWPEADRYGNLPMQGEKVTWVWYENF